MGSHNSKLGIMIPTTFVPRHSNTGFQPLQIAA